MSGSLVGSSLPPRSTTFRITVSAHDDNPCLYNANVDRFVQEVKANDELPLCGLGIHSLISTALSPGALTPRHYPIRLKQEMLGQWAVTVVRRYWDFSTGFEYAYKEPCNKKKFHTENWREEADIMRQISNVS